MNAGTLEGAGTFTKTGASTLTLSGTSTISNITITKDRLKVTGSLGTSTAVSVGANGVYDVDATDTIASIAGAGLVDPDGSVTGTPNFAALDARFCISSSDKISNPVEKEENVLVGTLKLEFHVLPYVYVCVCVCVVWVGGWVGSDGCKNNSKKKGFGIFFVCFSLGNFTNY